MGGRRKLRLVIILMLVTSLLLTGVVSADNGTARPFSDVDQHWAAQKLYIWIEKGVINGYTDGTFQPNRPITRAELSTLINRIFGYQTQENEAFTDVPANAWYAKDIALAKRAGYVSGYPDGTFRPNEAIRRMDAAVMMAAAFQIGSESVAGKSIRSFEDADTIPAYAKAAVSALTAGGALNGYPDGTFQPNKPITRAEAVVMLDSLVGELYNLAGKYQVNETLNNAVINITGVTLSNKSIQGNLYIASGVGDGDATLEQVTVKGKAFINGGGPNSVHMTDTTLADVTVNKPDSTVRIFMTGKSMASVVNVLTDTTIEVGNESSTGQIIVQTEGVKVNGKPYDKGLVLQVDNQGVVTVVKPETAIEPNVPVQSGGNGGSSGGTWRDETPPTAPGALSVTNVSESSISLSWTASTDNVGVVGYVITFADDVSAVETADTQATISGLQPGTAYTFTVKAKDAAGNVSLPSQVTATTSAPGDEKDETPPTAPGALSVTNVSESSISLSWAASTDNVGVAGYVITFADDVAAVETADTQATINGLQPGTEYTFTVKAKDAAGNLSLPSQVTARTKSMNDGEAPDSPAGLKAKTVTDVSVNLSWTAADDSAGVTHYRVVFVPVDGGDTITVTTQTNSIDVFNLYPGTAYRFAVSAVDDWGYESLQATLEVTTASGGGNLPIGWLPWQNADVGAVSRVGSASYANGEFTVNGSGKDITGSDDQFHFVYRTLNGDGTIVTRVTYFTNTHEYARAGVMIRESLTNSSKYAGIFYTQGSTSTTDNHIFIDQRRTTAGSSTANTRIHIASRPLVSENPVWLKIERINDTFNTYYSLDGVTWILGKATNIPMDTTVFIGLAVTSRDNSRTNTSKFDHVMTTGKYINLNDDTLPPTMPTELAASEITDRTVTLSWTASQDDFGIKEYIITYKSTAGSGELSTTNTATMVAGLAPDTEYTFRVRAISNSGMISEAASITQTTVSTIPDVVPPSAPDGLKVRALSDTTVDLNWGASTDNVGVIEYEVAYESTTLKVENTNATITGLLPDTTYTFSLRAKDSTGNYSIPATLSIKTNQREGDSSEAGWAELEAMAETKMTGVYTRLPGNFSGYTDAPLLGNGDLGVVTGGTSDSQTIYIDKNDFWENSSKLTLGGFTITNQTSGTIPASYRYEQDVLKAEIRANVTLKNIQLEMKTWVDANSNLIVTEIKAPDLATPTTVTLGVWAFESDSKPSRLGVDEANGVLWASRESIANPNNKAWVSRAAIASRVFGATMSNFKVIGGKAQADLILQPNQTVTIVTQVSGGGGESPNVPHVSKYIDMAKARLLSMTPDTIDVQHGAHLDWWKNFWLKSYVLTGNDLIDKYYFGALYALACSNRTGKASPGIFGNWIMNDTPGWGSRYFLNYNYENPYWGVYSSNRPELADAYFDHVLGYMPYGINRNHEAGYQGFSTTRSLARPYGPATVGWDPEAIPVSPVASTKDRSKLNDQLMLGAYLATNFINNYYYTKDIDFLRNKAYPFMISLADFWEDYLVFDEDRQRYVIIDSAPREANEHDNNSILDIAMVKYLMKALITASQDLDVDADRRVKWQDIVDKLVEYPTFSYDRLGGKTVFMESEAYYSNGQLIPNPGRPFMDNGGNHAVMTGLFWPSDEINLSTTSELKEIAFNTMDAYAGVGSWRQTNSFAMMYPAAMRIGYKVNEALDNFLAILGTGSGNNNLVHMRNNLTVYQKGGGIETSGSVETINAMMLQSYFDEVRQKNVIHIFPVLPKDRFPNVQFRKLRAMGAFLVSSGLQEGVITDVTLTSEKGDRVHLVNPFNDGDIQVVKVEGEVETSVAFTLDQDLISFDTDEGTTYIVRLN